MKFTHHSALKQCVAVKLFAHYRHAISAFVVGERMQKLKTRLLCIWSTVHDARLLKKYRYIYRLLLCLQKSTRFTFYNEIHSTWDARLHGRFCLTFTRIFFETVEMLGFRGTKTKIVTKTENSLSQIFSFSALYYAECV